MHTRRVATLLFCAAAGAALTGPAGPGPAVAQTPPGGGKVCRGQVSAFASGKEFYHVWVRVNADDSADVWVAGGAEVPADAIPPRPPAASRHSVTPKVSHFANDYVGVSLPVSKGPPVMLTFSDKEKVMATPRQRSGLACTP